MPVLAFRRPARLAVTRLEDRAVPAPLTVTSPADAGAGTLRQAITDANAAAGADAIAFDPALTGQTIALAAALPAITDPLTITGLGQAALTVRGTAGARVFQVNPGVAATITDLTVTGGSVAGNGGGILNNGGMLTLQRVTVAGNAATGGFSGGGVASTGAGAALTIRDSTVSGNTATGSGGGVFNDTTSTATITRALVTGNAAGNNANGAGVNNNGTMTVTGSTVSFNTGPSTAATPNFFGGGLANLGTGALAVVATTVVGNLSQGPGGGLFSNGTSLSVSDSTVANNTSASTPAGTGGGGVRVQGTGSLTVLSSTVTGNLDVTGSTTTNAGGISFGSTGAFTLNNTVVAQNITTTTGATAAPDVRSGVAVSGAGNFVGSDPNALSNLAAAQTNLGDPRLGPLANNGGPAAGGLAVNGPSPTRKPLPGSPLIDAGSNAAAAVLATDQRGFLRVAGTTVDVGAVEFQPPGATVTLTTSASPVLSGAPVTFTAAVVPTAAGPNNPPTGSVVFVIDGVTAATVPLTAGGSASFTASTLAVGAHAVRAEYLGDANFGPASATLSPGQDIVPPPPINPPPPPPSVLVGVADFAAGPDAGLASAVRFFNPDATEKFTLTPFAASFTGGVRVAAADFNGDGVPDLAVGTGPGIATSVRVLDGKTQAELFSVGPFEAAFTGGVFVAAGDIDGDGKAELIVTPDQGGGPRVRVFRGGDFAPLADFFGIDDPAFRGGARAAVGDVNGDGKGDLLVAAGFGGGPGIAVFDGKSIGLTPVKLLGDFFVFEQTLRNGVFVTAGDIDGDGFADVIVGGGPGGGPRVFALSGKGLLSGTQTQLANFFAGDVNNRGGIRVAVKNLDGDARADLVVGSGMGGGSRVTGYLGKNILSDTAPPEQFGFDAFVGFSGGVFVG
jgi:hypothetical protein